MEDFGTLTSGLTVQAVHGSGEGGFGIESRGPVGFQVVARDTTVSDKFARIDVGGQRG